MRRRRYGRSRSSSTAIRASSSCSPASSARWPPGRAPHAIAVEFGDQRLTYAELDVRANQLAHYLRKLGVGPDVLVGMCVERSLEMVMALLGIMKAGGAYVPIDPAYPAERQEY